MNQLKEIIRKDDETKRFIRCRQGVELYNMSRPQFGLFLEKILAMDPDVLHAEYFRPDEGMRIYHMGRTPIMQLAE